MAQYKTDIFEVLGNLNKKNHQYYTGLTEEEQKSIAPVVLMRWLSGTSNPVQVLLLNELVNPYVFSLQKHKQLLFDLMCTCTPGKFYKYTWLKANTGRQKNKPQAVEILCRQYDYSTVHATEVLPLFSDEEIISLAEGLGYQKEEITKLKAELKK